MSEQLKNLNEELQRFSDEKTTAVKFKMGGTAYRESEGSHLKTVWQFRENGQNYDLQNRVFMNDDVWVRSVNIAQGKDPVSALKAFEKVISDDEMFGETYNMDINQKDFFATMYKMVEDAGFTSKPKTKNKM